MFSDRTIVYMPTTECYMHLVRVLWEAHTLDQRGQCTRYVNIFALAIHRFT